MSTQYVDVRSTQESRRDAHLLRIMRWLLEDRTRTLPQPDDVAAINELAQAIGKSPEYTQALMLRAASGFSGGETVRLLT